MTRAILLVVLVLIGQACVGVKKGKSLNGANKSALAADSAGELSVKHATSDCNDVLLDSYIDAFANIRSQTVNNVWPTYAPSAQKIVVYKKSSKQAFALNFSDEDFVEAKIPAKSCTKTFSPSSRSNWRYHIADLSLAEAQNNMFVFGSFNIRNTQIFPDPIELRSNFYSHLDQAGFSQVVDLILSSKSPITAFMLPITLNSFGLSEELLKSFPVERQLAIRKMLTNPTDIFINIAMHEAFHAFQGSYWQPFDSNLGELSREFYASCVKSVDWSSVYFDELDIWTQHLTDILSEETIDRLKLIKIAEQIITNRQNSGKSNANANKCWVANANWERTEGTAWFVESQMKQQYGLRTSVEIVQEFKEYLNVSRHDVTEDEDAAFYASGALIMKLITKLASDDSWSEQIENGKSPQQILEKIIESSIMGKTSN